MSIKTNILLVFMTLVALIVTLLLYLQYYQAKEIAIYSVTKRVESLLNRLDTSIQNDALLTKKVLESQSHYSVIKKGITKRYDHPAMLSLIEFLEIRDAIRSIYFVHDSGDFYEVVNLNNIADRYKSEPIYKRSRWMVVLKVDDEVRAYYLNAQLEVIKEERLHVSIDLLDRSWYKEAKKDEGGLIITQPYRFSVTKDRGITFALAKKGVVVGVDYALEQLNTKLKRVADDPHLYELFLLDADGRKFATSLENSHYISSKIATKVDELLKDNRFDSVEHMDIDDQEYLLSLHRYSGFNLYVGAIVATKKLYAPYKESLIDALGIGLMSLIVALFLVYLFTDHLVAPIRKLIDENHKVAKRDFEKIKPITSSISEFKALSESLVSMAQDISRYQKAQESLLESIIKLIAEAIDAKSPYTSGHCKRVPVIATMLLEALNSSDDRRFSKDKIGSKDELRAFELGAWLHDCGKLTTPEYVVDKSVKLETIYNRIHEIRTRFEVILRDKKIAHLEAKLSAEALKEVQEAMTPSLKELQEEFAFIATCNLGGEYLDEQKIAKLHKIAQREWIRYFDNTLGLGPQEAMRMRDAKMAPAHESLLQDAPWHIIAREHFDLESFRANGFTQEVPKHLYNHGELYNLSISKGTLTQEERFKINEHIIVTIKMLESIPFPEELKDVAYYAGTHHEKLDGSGYPRGLKASDLNMPARIMVLADIFEALTASDRPYNRAKKLSEVIKIMSFMVEDNHIDADLFRLFLESGLYKKYAMKYLRSEQIDEVDISYYCSRTNEA